MEPQSIVFDGTPPTVNNMYTNIPGRGRIKSKKYRAWIEAVNWQVAAQRPSKVHGEVEVAIFVKRPDKRKRDLDNLCKASLDMLVSNALIEDDSKIVKLSIEWTQNPDIAGTLIIYKESNNE